MKRRIEVRFTKPKKTDGSEVDTEDDFEMKGDYIVEVMRDLAGDVVKLAVGYIILDTIRKAVVARASRPVIVQKGGIHAV